MVLGKRGRVYSMLKVFPRMKSQPREFASLEHPVYFPLLFTFYVGMIHLNNSDHVSSCMLNKNVLKSYMCSIRKLPKTKKKLLFFSFYALEIYLLVMVTLR